MASVGPTASQGLDNESDRKTLDYERQISRPSIFNAILQTMMLQVFPQSAAENQLEEDAEKSLGVKFWKGDSELAAVNFYIRTRGGASVEFLVTPQLYEAGMRRSWSQGNHNAIQKNEEVDFLKSLEYQILSDKHSR